jgi:N-acetylglucosamine kinase-like BadF-type ATPase
MSTVFVGVDSGGTRTNVVVVVEGTNSRREYEVDESLSGALEPQEYADCLRAILAPLGKAYESLQAENRPTYVFVSAAAYTPRVRNDLIKAISTVVPSVAGPQVVAAGIANDSLSLLIGSGATGIVIAGTGSNVLIKPTSGDPIQVGGHEWVACDNGSGFWIGLRAIRQAYRDFEDRENSVLLQRFRQLYRIDPGDDNAILAMLRKLSIAGPNMKKDIARFATDVCGAAQRGDPQAQNIVKAEAEDLGDMLAAGIRRALSSQAIMSGVSIVQCGGVLGNEFYRAAFETQVEMRLLSASAEKANIQWQRVSTATDAAVNLARSLRDSTDDLLALGEGHRPAIVRF